MSSEQTTELGDLSKRGAANLSVEDVGKYEESGFLDDKTMDTSIQPPHDPYSPEVKRRTLVAVLTQVLIGNMMVSNLMAFLPIFVETNEWEKDANGVSSQLTSNDVGFIIASFSLAQVMFSPFNSLIKNYLGTKNAISIGMLLVGISTALLGFIARVQDGRSFLYLSLALRYVQGAGDILLQITCYGVLCQFFANDIAKHIGYIEISVGFGNGLGPGVGGFLYPLFGYEYTMYVFGVLCFIGMVLGMVMIPNELNHPPAADAEERQRLLSGHGQEVDPRSQLRIGWKELLTQKESVFALLSVLCGTYNIMYWSSWLSAEILKIGFTESSAGFLLMLMSFCYLFGCLVYPYTCGLGSRRFQFMVAFVGFGVASFMLGPSLWLGFPQGETEENRFWTQCLVAAAFPVLGSFQVFVFIPIIPEILDRMNVAFEITEGQYEAVDISLTDKVNDAYGVFYAGSQLISPVIGSELKTRFGAPQSCDAAAAFNLVFALVLFIFNGGPSVLSENRAMKKKLKQLKARPHDGYDKDDNSSNASSNARRRKVLGPSQYGIDGPQKSNKDGFSALNDAEETAQGKNNDKFSLQ